MTLTPQRLAAVSEVIEKTFGLHYPPDRGVALQRLLTRASKASGGVGLETLVESLLAGPLSAEHKALLIDTLTIGETYFFREPEVFNTLAWHLGGAQANPAEANNALRVWSAGCCTGEEAYSLAIMFDRHRARFAQRHIELLATDINPRYLQGAKSAIYGPWSFRGAPPWLQAKYFHPLGDGRHQVCAEIRAAVKFAQLNLATDDYPSIKHGTLGLDLVLCRHVLMYFSPQEFARVIHQLAACLREGGWLVVSTAEVGLVNEPSLVSTRIEGVTVFVKRSHRPRATTVATPKHNGHGDAFSVSASSPVPLPPRVTKPATMSPAQRAPRPPGPPDAHNLPGPPFNAALLSAARAHADQGNLPAALEICDQLLRQDKLQSFPHFLRASVLSEMGDPREAVLSLRRAIYLEPDCIAAHLLLASLERLDGRAGSAERHWRTARGLATRIPPATLLSDAAGLTAGQLLTLVSAQTEEPAKPSRMPHPASASPRRRLAGNAVLPG